MTYSQTLIKALLLILVMGFFGCRSHSTGRVNVHGDQSPHFTFTGDTVTYVLVYRVPAEYLSKGIPLKVLTKDNPDTQWVIEGTHEARDPIRYGLAPQGMKELVAPKALTDGPTYFVSTYIGTEDTAAFVGQYFKLQNGRAIEVHEDTLPNHR
jgi:hypothetical protein